jgi:predicted RNA polymerase sigma factor
MTGLGEVLASLGRREQAQHAMVQGIELLQQVNAAEYLSQARKLLATL